MNELWSSPSVRLRSLIRERIHQPIFMLLIVVFAFILLFASVFPIKIEEMGSGEFFVENIIPSMYWVGVIVIVSATLLMIKFLEDRRFKMLFIFSLILLMVSIRIVFPAVFVTIPAYETDAKFYMNVVDSWATSGLDFGKEGNYQHDYPVSFLIASVFVKFGVPLEAFFRMAPFFIYAIDLILLYLLVVEIFPGNKSYSALSAFLLSFSSLGYWITVHYSPDLVGTLFYFLSLYFSVRFVLKDKLSAKALLPVLLSIFVLMLSHHLSLLYLIVTLFGFSFSAWFFKQPHLKRKAISFLLLGIYTYTLWFTYGSFVYPSFFNVYVYFQGFTSPSALMQQATLLDQVTFAIYPIFIFMLFIYEFLRLLKVRNLSDVVKLPKKFREARASEKPAEMSLVYTLGFVFVGFLFLVGFVIPATFPLRVLEVLLVGLYPVSSQTLIRVGSANPSKKKTVFMLAVLIFVTLTGIHRYYRQIQRSILFR